MSNETSASFEGLRKQAKRWLKAIRGGDAEARARFDALLPRHSAAIGLREVQQALARERGFDNWARLKEQLEIDGLAALGSGALLDELLNKACIAYADDWPSNWKRAERIVTRHPELAQASIYSAALCGELERVRELLDSTPSLVNQKGGPRGWEPLLFVCYGRLPIARAADQSLAIAQLLLERGADPNAHWLAPGGDSSYRFSALTGAMGQGELSQPEHPRAERLARLLLDAGADANDSQGLYDTCLQGDETRWLELLSEFGLDDRTVNWATEASPQTGNLSFLISYAASNGQAARLSWLLAHGADPNALSVYTGKTCYESALLAGHAGLASLLVAHGARVTELSGADAFVAAAARGDREASAAIVVAQPECLASSEPLVNAANRGDARAVGILLELGLDPNRPGKHHLALNAGSAHRAVCELLLAHGADPRGRTYGATAAAWALHGKHVEQARFLAEHSRLLLDAVMTGHVALASDLIASEPRAVHERSPSGNTPLHLLPEDPDTAEVLLALLLGAGADPEASNDDGRTPRQALESSGRDEVVDRLDAHLP